MFEYSNEGVSVADGWGTLLKAARFGTDYVTRTASAKANIFANPPEESTYFFTDDDIEGNRLTGDRAFTVTFRPGELPPVRGFWSLTLYDAYHFFARNDLNRFSIGTKNKTLQVDQDGSLTIHVQHQSPGAEQETNWLPAPTGEFCLFLRAYWPDDAILSGAGLPRRWPPPPPIDTQTTSALAAGRAVT